MGNQSFTSSPKGVGKHCLVLGAGLAGLSAAAALAERFQHVTVIERDSLSSVAEPRKGVPQGRHVHLLLPAGLVALERLFPGIKRALESAGAEILAGSDDFRVNLAGGQLDLSRPNPDFVLVGATRPLIEAIVRDRLRTLPNVTVRSGLEVLGLTAGDTVARGRGAGRQSFRDTSQGRYVSGVRVRKAGKAGDGREQMLAADLVVDATGRGSRAPHWLELLGYSPPEEERVQVNLRYTTRLFQRRVDDANGSRNILISALPGQKCGGVALAVEGNRWIVTLTGLLGEQPPGDIEGFRAFTANLWNRDLHAFLVGAKPIGEAVTGSYPANSRRRFDRLARFPGRFVVLGDALCPFNPVYGQGMSVAALEALELGRVLDRVGPQRVGQAFFRAVRGLVDEAWTQAVDNDLRHPEVAGRRTLRWRLVCAYGNRLLPVAHRDPTVGRAFFDVMGMLAPGASLMRPSILLRVLLGRLRNRAQAMSPSNQTGTAEAQPYGK